MQTKDSTTHVLILVIIVLTFPIWIGIVGGVFGLVGGIAGGLFGLVTGMFGAVFRMIGILFGWLFDWSCGGPFGWWSTELMAVLAIALVIVLASRSRRR
jgi:hypothetical protein